MCIYQIMPIQNICTLKNLCTVMIYVSAKLDVGVETADDLSHPGILKSSQVENLPFALFIFENDIVGVSVCV